MKAYLVKETEHLAVYVENGYSISDYALVRIYQDFENYYTDMINIYGDHTDLDGNSKVILLLMKLNQTTSTTTSSVLGYFRPSDLIYGKGNNGEILYMDIEKAINRYDSGDHFISSSTYSTLQKELTRIKDTMGEFID